MEGFLFFLGKFAVFDCVLVCLFLGGGVFSWVFECLLNVII